MTIEINKMIPIYGNKEDLTYLVYRYLQCAFENAMIADHWSYNIVVDDPDIIDDILSELDQNVLPIYNTHHDIANIIFKKINDIYDEASLRVRKRFDTQHVFNQSIRVKEIISWCQRHQKNIKE